MWSPVVPAPHDRQLAQVLASAPNVEPIMRAVAVLSEGWRDLLSTSVVADPALHDAVARMIGTNAERCILASWAEIASEGWRTTHADALVNVAPKNTFNAVDPATLIVVLHEVDLVDGDALTTDPLSAQRFRRRVQRRRNRWAMTGTEQSLWIQRAVIAR